MSRVIFVNRTYWPGEEATAQVLTDLAEGLAGKGHDIHVITGRRRGLPETDQHRGVKSSASVHSGRPLPASP